MKVLVTGADGMLGSNLVRLLLQREHEVSVFLFPSSKSTTLDGLKIRIFFGDVLDPGSLDEPFNGIDAVIHAAANTSIWPPRSEMVRKVNIEGTRNIVEKVLEHKIGKLVYVGSASSVNTQGSSNDKYPFPVKTRNLPAVAILPTYMIGPYDSLPGSGTMILALATGKLKVYTGGGRNFIHVADVATAVANSLEKPCLGKYYIAGNENLSYKSFFGKVAAVTGKPAPKIKVPGWIVKPVGFLGSLAGGLTKKQPLVSCPMARISCENQFVESKEAVSELGMPQTPIEMAIADCYNWFRENRYC
jgi:dihydroflavonol-4-reductase